MISAMSRLSLLPTATLTLFAIALVACPASGFQIEERSGGVPACAPSGVVYTRTTLYFGLARPAGTISEKQWKAFVREEVTSRFPQGFTAWEAGNGRPPTARLAGSVPKCCCSYTRTPAPCAIR